MFNFDPDHITILMATAMSLTGAGGKRGTPPVVNNGLVWGTDNYFVWGSTNYLTWG